MSKKILFVTLLGLVCFGGCGLIPSLDPAFYSGIAKLGSDWNDPAIGSLTADEIVALSRDLPTLAQQYGVPVPEEAMNLDISQSDAQTIVDFLDQQGVNTVSELQTKIDNNEITEDEVPQVVKDLATAFGATITGTPA